MSGVLPESTLPSALPTNISPAPTDAAESTLDRPRLTRARRGLWRDALEVIALVVVIYTLVNLTTARAIVEGPSMQPNFYTGQLLIVNLFSYYFTSPARGDVVVLHNPSPSCQSVIAQNAQTIVLLPNNDNTACDDLIKRVIGLPGDKIVIDDNGRVTINGTRIEEPYIAHFCTDGKCSGHWQLTASQYFVLGDNRANSYDSHAFGPIDHSLIVGRAWIRYWPLSDFSIIPQPSYTNLTPTPVAP